MAGLKHPTAWHKMLVEVPMGSIVVELTAVSANEVAVSIDYGGTAAPMVKRWRAERTVLDGIGDEVDRLIQDALRERLTDREAGEMSRAVEEGFKRAGLALFQTLFKSECDTIKSLARDEAGRYSLLFRIDKSLAYLPLEVMHDGSSHLSLRFALGRVIYTEDVYEPPRASTPEEPYKVLIVGDPSGDSAILKDVESEIDTVRAVFMKRSGFRPLVTAGRDADQAFILAGLPGSIIFHFSGHGAASDDDRLTGIRLSDGQVLSGYSIRGLQDPPAFAFLNMCAATSQQAWKTSVGLVEVLLRRGTRACIATLWDLGSTTASSIASPFYQLLLEGQTFGEALRQARSAVVAEHGAGDPTWAAYTLYGDPGLRLLPEGRPDRQEHRFRKPLAALVGLVMVLVALLLPGELDKHEPVISDNRPVGYLLLESDPADATIFIDGEEIGLTPHTAEVTVGNHQLVIVKQGYKRWEASIEAKQNQRTDAKAHLEPID
jgi:hypothetical protein